MGIAIGYLVSSDDFVSLFYFPGIDTFTATFEGETSEVSLGVRKIIGFNLRWSEAEVTLYAFSLPPMPS